MREEHCVGIQYLEAATVLLRRIRNAHPTAGLYEAADLHWWWRTPRSTDNIGQLFWFDAAGRPEAAVILTQWGDTLSLQPIVMPDATPQWVTHVIERGLAHASELGYETIEVMVDRADQIAREVLAGHGFANSDGSTDDVETWLVAENRPKISSLHGDYRLCTRLDTMQFPHHMIQRNGPDVETRLRQTSLYRPDLDLVVVHGGSSNESSWSVAAYGMFWFDPETSTGLVEPMRTHDDHQRKGLGRHVLTTGIDRLVAAGATRIKVIFRPNNPAARNLYLGVGFQPVKETVVLTRTGRDVGQR